MPVDSASAPVMEQRLTEAVFGKKAVTEDARWEWEYAAHLRATYSPAELLNLYSRQRSEEGAFAAQLRRILVRAMSRKAGNGLVVEAEVVLKHTETMEFGDSVFLGAQTMIQGRFDGRCKIGNHVWIGPHSYFDARDLIIEDYVGWGPGAKVLGSTHTGYPIDVPIISTELAIKSVFVGYGADIGTNATLLPGVRVGAHSIVGAGSVVTSDVPEYAVVAGVPAKLLKYRQ